MAPTPASSEDGEIATGAHDRFNLGHDSGNATDSLDRGRGVGLNPLNKILDLTGCLGRLAGRFPDLVGDHGKPLAGLASPGRLNGGVQVCVIIFDMRVETEISLEQSKNKCSSPCPL